MLYNICQAFFIFCLVAWTTAIIVFAIAFALRMWNNRQWAKMKQSEKAQRKKSQHTLYVRDYDLENKIKNRDKVILKVGSYAMYSSIIFFIPVVVFANQFIFIS